jgi:hypothetical protein
MPDATIEFEELQLICPDKLGATIWPDVDGALIDGSATVRNGVIVDISIAATVPAIGLKPSRPCNITLTGPATWPPPVGRDEKLQHLARTSLWHLVSMALEDRYQDEIADTRPADDTPYVAEAGFHDG